MLFNHTHLQGFLKAIFFSQVVVLMFGVCGIHWSVLYAAVYSIYDGGYAACHLTVPVSTFIYQRGN